MTDTLWRLNSLFFTCLYFQHRLVGKCPNTYAYTKAIAEQLLREEHGDIPLAIVRPSTVTAALFEPMPGWIDNINGPTGSIFFINPLFTIHYNWIPFD